MKFYQFVLFLSLEWGLLVSSVEIVLGGIPSTQDQVIISDDLVLEEVKLEKDEIENIYIDLTSKDRVYTSKDYEAEYDNLISHFEIDFFDIIEDSMDMDIRIMRPKTIIRWVKADFVNCVSTEDPNDQIQLTFGDEIEILMPEEDQSMCQVLSNGNTYYIDREHLSDSSPKMKLLGNFSLTAYAWTGNRCANGRYPQVNYTVAAHPKDLPLGSKIYIEDMGMFIVEDRGAFSRGIIDIYMADRRKCVEFGRKRAKVYLISKGDNKRYRVK